MLAGLAAGALAGVAAAGDIGSSFRAGRIAHAAVPPIPAEPRRIADGFELSAQLGLSTRDDCRTLALALRPGCADYVAGRGSAAAEPLDLPL